MTEIPVERFTSGEEARRRLPRASVSVLCHGHTGRTRRRKWALTVRAAYRALSFRLPNAPPGALHTVFARLLPVFVRHHAYVDHHFLVGGDVKLRVNVSVMRADGVDRKVEPARYFMRVQPAAYISKTCRSALESVLICSMKVR